MLGRGPRLLRREQLPTGFVYPAGLASAMRSTTLPAWEWLEGPRLQRAAERLWQHHPRLLVPVAVRRDTSFLVCLVAADGGPGEAPDPDPAVVTVDALRADAEPVQHLPSLQAWIDAATTEVPRTTGPPSTPSVGPSVDPSFDPAVELPDEHAASEVSEGWTPPEKGSCACFKHLDDVSLAPIPYGAHAPDGLPPRTVADLVMAGQLRAEADGSGPFHWRAGLGEEARLHLDDDGRTRIEYWLMGNPGVEAAVAGELGDLHLRAPTLCRDGVLTLLGRALLDDRVRRRRRRR